MRSSSAAEQVTVNHFVAGSIPAFAAILAPLAQLVEQLICNQQVVGSIPSGCSIQGPLAQLVRASACHAEGCGFKSHTDRHLIRIKNSFYISDAESRSIAWVSVQGRRDIDLVNSTAFS